MNIQGRCLCGKISYQVVGTLLDMLNCHCSMCRKSQGTAFSTWIAVERKLCSIVSEVNLQSFASSKEVTRYFCCKCGSNLFWQRNPRLIWVAAGTLDTDPGIQPSRDIFLEDKVNWYTNKN
ncbi:GFA family protein [Candidatus Uabimicrobium sp. HlEnr_7]|uniref:GFA family protein n=1 Tax=Candidatus Uabimicrobium helgolandensis TaxID=3095367 RepID=UPI0035576C97